MVLIQEHMHAAVFVQWVFQLRQMTCVPDTGGMLNVERRWRLRMQMQPMNVINASPFSTTFNNCHQMHSGNIDMQDDAATSD